MMLERNLRRSCVLILGALLACGALSFGQVCPPAITLSHAAADQLTLADIDFEHFRPSTLLFTLSIANPQPLAFDVTLSAELDIQFADGSGNFPGAVTFSTQPFSVPVGGRVITNINLGLGGTDIKTRDFHFNDEAKQRLKDAGLGTGTLPAGIYTFHLSVQSVGCPDASQDQFVLVIANASRIELRSPRDGESTSQFPLFEFSYDGTNAELVVAEQTADQTREDAIARKPAMLDVDLSNQNSFLYSGGRPLEVGKTYVWRVIGKIHGVNGIVTDLPSDVGQFVVTNDAAPTGSVDFFLSQLEEIFGNRYPGIFQEIRQGGFTLDNTMTLNGVPVTPQDLINLLNQLRDQADTAQLSFE